MMAPRCRQRAKAVLTRCTRQVLQRQLLLGPQATVAGQMFPPSDMCCCRGTWGSDQPRGALCFMHPGHSESAQTKMELFHGKAKLNPPAAGQVLLPLLQIEVEPHLQSCPAVIFSSAPKTRQE